MPTQSHLSPEQILRLCHRPLYYLLIRSQPIRNGNFRPKVEAQGYAQVQVTPRGKWRGRAALHQSPIACVYIPGLGEFNNYIDGTGEREDLHLYLFDHRIRAEEFLEDTETQNRQSALLMSHHIRENLGDVRFE